MADIQLHCILLRDTTEFLSLNICSLMGPMCMLKIKGTFLLQKNLIRTRIYENLNVNIIFFNLCYFKNEIVCCSGLVPLHNACSYGHYEVTELLVKHGASVNVADLWKFTPLHEAAAKGKCEIVRLLLRHGADATKKNRDGATPLDLVREGDQDVADLLRGNSALLDAAKKGNLARVQRLVSQDNINCRDAQGRNSTPLHLAGYKLSNIFHVYHNVVL